MLVTTHTQARFVLPPAVARIKQAYPQVSVHLQQAAESDALDLLSQGDADIAIVSTSGAVPQAGVAVPLYRWRRLVLVPRGHALDVAGRAPTLRDLTGQALISYESSVKPSSSLRMKGEARKPGDTSSRATRVEASARSMASRHSSPASIRVSSQTCRPRSST